MVISCACLGPRHSPHSNYLCSAPDITLFLLWRSVGPRFNPFTSPTRSWCATCWTTIKIVQGDIFSIFWDGEFVGSSPPPWLYQSVWVVGAKPPDVDISTTCLTKMDHFYYSYGLLPLHSLLFGIHSFFGSVATLWLGYLYTSFTIE